jgi:predicted GTPase
MNKEQANELFQQVKTRFIAACKEIMLVRLKDIQDRFTEVDPDLILELVILTGVGFINRMDRNNGTQDAAEFLDNLLQELLLVACQHDDGLMNEINNAAAVIEKRGQDESSQQDGKKKQVKITIGDPLPGVGLFGFHFSRGEN